MRLLLIIRCVLCKSLLWAQTGSCCQFCSFAVLSCPGLQFFLHLIHTWDKRPIIPAQPQKSFSPWHFYPLIKRMTKWQIFTDFTTLVWAKAFRERSWIRLHLEGEGHSFAFPLCEFWWNYENQFFCDLFSVPLGRIPSPSRLPVSPGIVYHAAWFKTSFTITA